MITNSEQFFIMSASCRIVRGSTRSLLIDYGRGKTYLFPNDYYHLIQLLNRNRIREVEKNIFGDSKQFFLQFLDTMLSLEIAFLTNEPEMFPEIRNEIEEPFLLNDAIIEIDESIFSPSRFNKIADSLDSHFCEDIQLRLLSPFNLELLCRCLDELSSRRFNYVEIHCSAYSGATPQPLLYLLENYATLTHIYIYGAQEVKVIEHSTKTPGNFPVSRGMVYFLNYEFNEGQCCGMINFDNLDFSSANNHDRHIHSNGCLDKKVAIDKYGNIKNCPSLKNSYGNIEQVNLSDVLNMPEFLKYGRINKDQIRVCKDCEFRYNCSDCRAFLNDPEDLFSKPLKCGYDPYAGKWEEWSANPLKDSIAISL